MKNANITAQNEETARLLMNYDRTIALLRCGADDESVGRLASILRDDGWFVYEITDENFMKLRGEQIGGITIICDGGTLSPELE